MSEFAQRHACIPSLGIVDTAGGRCVRTSTGDESKCVIAVLRILPELNVAVIEDVSAWVQVVKGLGREHHANIVPRVK